MLDWEPAPRFPIETERLSHLAEATSDAVVVTDRDLRLLAWNRGAEQLYGWLREEVLGRELPHVPADQREQTIAMWRRVLEEGTAVVDHKESSRAKGGARIEVLTTLSPLFDDGQQAVGVMAIIKNLTLLKELAEQQSARARLEERARIAMDLHDNTIQAIH